jgi:2-amino-4-hydroxy-6-hydroxymethyldihydropteridine diphosphokinase
VVSVSRYHETAPVGDEAGAGFLNAAAELENSLTPLDLLDKLQAVERDLGRTRSTHWGPRTLDLDLVFWESQIINSPRLVIPHPAAWYRRFVLDPLVEIAPRFVHPVKQVDICTLRERLLVRPLHVSFAGRRPSESRTQLIGRLASDFPDVEFSDWESASHRGPDPASVPALILWLGPESVSASGFESLPSLPRIAVPDGSQPVHDFVRYVIQSALG